jgi:Holliday junction resolvase YEN1
MSRNSNEPISRKVRTTMPSTVIALLTMFPLASDEAYQGIDKNIFYRICKLLTLNIQFIFVFDGPKRPWKRGKRGGSRVDYAEIQLLEQTLRYFGIPAHRAPGEAEAECARMQELGVVDAVYSQDSDALMFGCDYLIRDNRIAKVQGSSDRSKENTQKNAKTVRVVRGDEIKAKHNLDREGLVPYAMLCGGDYNEQGLPKCGPALAKRAINHGLGKSLFQCRKPADVMRWREIFVDWLPRGFCVPAKFPELKTLVKYTCPTISTDEQLLDLNGVRNGWQQPIKELPLLRLTCDRFNIGGKRYLNWVGPVLLMRSFVAKDSRQPRTNEYQVKLTKRIKKTTGQPEARAWERKLTFSPFELTTLPRNDLEEL